MRSTSDALECDLMNTAVHCPDTTALGMPSMVAYAPDGEWANAELAELDVLANREMADFEARYRVVIVEGVASARSWASGRATLTTKPAATRRRPAHVPASRGETLELARAIGDDPRARELVASERLVVVTAVIYFADGDGTFYVTLDTLADRAGVSRSGVVRAVKNSVAAGLIKRESYTRPNGMTGATTYRVDPDLVALARERAAESGRTAGGSTHKVGQLEQAQDGSPAIRRNGSNVSTERRSGGPQSDRALAHAYISVHGRPTGSRWARGEASGTFVRDVLGHDKPSHPVPWGTPPLDEVGAELRRRRWEPSS